jgi:hypothetical protein
LRSSGVYEMAIVLSTPRAPMLLFAVATRAVLETQVTAAPNAIFLKHQWAAMRPERVVDRKK